MAVLTNAIDGPADELATTAVRIIDLAAHQDHDSAPAGAGRFQARLANLWGVQDVVLLGGRLLVLDPTSADPTESPLELSVESETSLRVTKGPGYRAVGERMDYTFADDGSVASVRGAGGMTWWPLEDYAVPG